MLQYNPSSKKLYISIDVTFFETNLFFSNDDCQGVLLENCDDHLEPFGLIAPTKSSKNEPTTEQINSGKLKVILSLMLLNYNQKILEQLEIQPQN